MWGNKNKKHTRYDWLGLWSFYALLKSGILEKLLSGGNLKKKTTLLTLRVEGQWFSERDVSHKWINRKHECKTTQQKQNHRREPQWISYHQTLSLAMVGELFVKFQSSKMPLKKLSLVYFRCYGTGVKPVHVSKSPLVSLSTSVVTHFHWDCVALPVVLWLLHSCFLLTKLVWKVSATCSYVGILPFNYSPRTRQLAVNEQTCASLIINNHFHFRLPLFFVV